MNSESNENKSHVDNLVSFLTLTISFLVSISVAFISIAVEFDAFETVTTTMLSFLCSEYFIQSLLLKSKYFKAKKTFNFMDNMHEWTEKLYEMNSYSESILKNRHGNNDLFLVTCARSIDNLYYLLKTAAVEKKIEMTEDFIINTMGVFDALNVTSSKNIELTFPIDEITEELLQTAEDKKFFETTYKMATDKRVNQIRVLIILGDEGLLKNNKLKALCRFYESNTSYECKYILKSDFIVACEHNLIPTSGLDFGIYGPQMLFRVEQYDPYRGVYSKDESQVKRYLALFNEVWNFESVTHVVPIGNDEVPDHMSPKELFSKLEELKNQEAEHGESATDSAD